MMKVKDLIKEDIDTDVYDNYDERCGMAVCGPIRLIHKWKEIENGTLYKDDNVRE